MLPPQRWSRTWADTHHALPGEGCPPEVPQIACGPEGRLYITNTLTFDVRVVDNAGNEICRFGHYGNFDSQWVPDGSKDGKPLVSTPDIPLALPLAVGASERNVYVGDVISRRVARVAKKFAAEETCAIK